MLGDPRIVDLLHDYEHALDILHDCVKSMAAVLSAQRTGETLPETQLTAFEHQCTAARVSAAELRARLTVFRSTPPS